MSTRRRSDLAGSALAACCALLALSSSARADDDGLTPYRDRFRLGMEKYKAGSLAEAIRVWGAIYEEIGPKRGYRLSFDLGRAYDTNGEATRAAERYRSFLDETSARRTAGEELEPIVVREAHEAEARLEDLNQGHGRIEIAPGGEATLEQVDDSDPRLGAFTAYVAPGKHVVTFGPGREDAEKVEITVAAGEVVVARPTRPLKARDPVTLPPLDPVIPTKKHPFSPVVLYVGGVATAASILAPALGYGHAWSVYDSYNSTTNPQTKNLLGGEYSGARTVAYGLLAVPLGFAAITGGLVTWYFAGTTTEHTVAITFDAAPRPGGWAGSMRLAF